MTLILEEADKTDHQKTMTPTTNMVLQKNMEERALSKNKIQCVLLTISKHNCAMQSLSHKKQ